MKSFGSIEICSYLVWRERVVMKTKKNTLGTVLIKAYRGQHWEGKQHNILKKKTTGKSCHPSAFQMYFTL